MLIRGLPAAALGYTGCKRTRTDRGHGAGAAMSCTGLVQAHGCAASVAAGEAYRPDGRRMRRDGFADAKTLLIQGETRALSYT